MNRRTAIGLICAGVVTLQSALGDGTPEPLGNPHYVQPRAVARISPQGVLTSPWYQLGDGGVAQTICNTLLAFDNFEPDGGVPGFPTECVPPDCGMGSARWWFGTSYYAGTFSVNDMFIGCEAAVGAASERIEFAWAWGPCWSTGGIAPCQIAVYTLEDWADCAPGSPASYGGTYSGIVYDFGTLTCNPGFYYAADITELCDFGLFHQLPADGSGSYAFILGSLSSSGGFVLAEGAQMMLWGTKVVDFQGPRQLDDDNPRDGAHNLDDVSDGGECYDYAFGVCPDPLGSCVAFYAQTGREPCAVACQTGPTCEILGARVLRVGATHEITGVGDPAGGTFAWSATPASCVTLLNTTGSPLKLRVNSTGGSCSTVTINMTYTLGGGGTCQKSLVIKTEAAKLESPPAMPPAVPAPAPASGAAPAKPKEGEPADPVHLFNGEFYLAHEDLRISGRGFDFVWARHYRSRNGPSTAQGHGWDFAYNVRLEAAGSDLALYDGNTRRDVYYAGGGTWERPEFFRSIVQNGNGTFTLTFADQGQWHFHPLNGSPQAGKLSSIVDRNGNIMTLQYDGSGRLTTITDTLGRNVTVAYTGSNIASVTDFAGRQVQYQYYNGVEPGGGLGDLKSVRTPVVTGTPTGNDFPLGKLTTYTYSTGSGDANLNHNLLTITDAKGQTYLINFYATTTNTNAIEYDHLVRQNWGDAGDLIDLVYVAQTPTSGNGYAVVKAIVNDRVGNVKEYSYDGANRLVLTREYTGRAPNPDAPTTESANRPTGKLRASDPNFFDTRYEYNADDLPTRIIDPNTTETLFVYDSLSAEPQSRGNMLQRTAIPGLHTPIGDQVQIAQTFEYDDGPGGSNFVTRQIDGRGNQTLYQYDASGNLTRRIGRIASIVDDWEYNGFGQLTAHVLPANGSGHRRRDEYTYYSGGSQNGFLKDEITDATNFALTTTYEYDAVGNVVRTIDPRGDDTLYVVNQLDQVVRTTTHDVNGGGVRYQRDRYYDANDNVVRVDVQNVDDQGVLQANTHFTTVYEYETLNHRVRECREVGSYAGSIPGPPDDPTCVGLPDDEFITTAYDYDDNRNCTLVANGEAAEGRQPANTVTTVYDERGRVFRRIRASGSAAQSSTQYDYDGNHNTVSVSEGLESAPRVTISVYDAYDRLVTRTDPMSNVLTQNYDANGNVTREHWSGQLIDVPGSAGNTRLAETTYIYDAMDRRTREDVKFFNPATQSSYLDGNATTTTAYASNSQVTSVTNDNGHTTTWAYDTANRTLARFDAKGNETTYVYDENSNVISISELELSDLGNPDQTFVTTYAYDGLDRRVMEVDNVGNSTLYAYDSRSNRTTAIDALGRETRYAYDGWDRRVAMVQDMDADGADFADPDDIVTGTSWDDSSRTIGRTDDNGNTTAYAYDALDRRVFELRADGTEHSYVYDVHDNVASSTDANGNVVTNTYDELNRLTNRSIAVGAGVSNETTFEIYQYDGVGRLRRAEDNDAVVTRDYDSMSNVRRETLNGENVDSSYDGVGNQNFCTYPGGRSFSRGYDELERVDEMYEGFSIIAAYAYIGPQRVERRELGNGTRTDYTYDGVANAADDFGVRQIIRTRHTKISNGSVIDDRTYIWDPVGNKTSRLDLRTNLRHSYSYDAADRLIRTLVTQPTGTNAIAIRRLTNYELDGVHNREQVSGRFTRPPVAGNYEMDAGLPEHDFEVNQYSQTPEGARLYDANGNLKSVAERTMWYNYRNQMVQHDDFPWTSTYRYDALGRRISRFEGLAEYRYFYDGWRVIEEQTPAGATVRTYVHGRYIDELLQLGTSFPSFYYHADDMHSVMALTDPSGNVVLRFEYDDYGRPLDPQSLVPISQWNVEGHLFNGRDYDPETGWYNYRTRYMDPIAGRFTTRDAIGTWSSGENHGNAYAFVGSNPASYTDPFGRDGPAAGNAPGNGDAGAPDPAGNTPKAPRPEKICVGEEVYDITWNDDDSKGTFTDKNGQKWTVERQDGKWVVYEEPPVVLIRQEHEGADAPSGRLLLRVKRRYICDQIGFPDEGKDTCDDCKDDEPLDAAEPPDEPKPGDDDDPPDGPDHIDPEKGKGKPSGSGGGKKDPSPDDKKKQGGLDKTGGENKDSDSKKGAPPPPRK